jgi:ElaB/YqjD/DUF883 family membrane-anchored ribosome-binding protein
MKILLAPLQRLGNLIEEQNEKINEIHSVLTIDLVKASEDSQKELAQQTLLLSDIKSLLAIQVKQGELERTERSKGGKFKMQMPNMKGVASIGLAVISMAAALVIAGAFFMFMPVLNPLKLLSALAVAGVIYLAAPAFVKIAESLSKLKGGGKGELNPENPYSALKDGMGVVTSMIGMAAALVLAGAVLFFMPTLNLRALIGAAIVAGVLYLAADPFVKTVEALSKLKGGGVKGVGGTDIKSMMQMMGMALLSMVGMAVAIVLSSWVFMLMPNLEIGKMLGAFAVAAVLYIVSIPYVKILKALKSGRVGIKEIGMAALALPLIALGVVAAAWIFQLLPGNFVAPPWQWSLEAGLALLVFGVPFMIIAKMGQKVSMKGLLMATIEAPLIAIGILATAWIFQILPSEFKAPPLEWSTAAGLGILMFAIPFMIIGALATAITPVGLLLGAAGIILIAASMFVVAWIFSALPDLSAIAKNFTDAIMYPINAMIDALVRVKEEIGIENLLPLAGGLFAIAGGWLALVAALAGQAAGGLFSSVANLGSSIIDGIGSLFGAKKTKTPIELLDMLIGRTAGIIALADPIKTIGIEFAKVALNTNAVIKGMGAVLQLADNSDELEEAGEAMKEIGQAYKAIADASRIMNVPAIEASARMFEAIAKIAENDGEDAITVLARELMNAVQELSETVENLEKVSKEQGAASKSAIESALEKMKDTIFSAKKKAGGGQEAETATIADVVLAIENLESRLDLPLRVKGSAYGA